MASCAGLSSDGADGVGGGASGSLDPQFVGPALTLNALFESPSVSSMLVVGDRLYIGGKFDSVGGETSESLAALDKTTGAVLDTYEIRDGSAQPGAVKALAAGTGSSFFVGGSFATVAGEAHPNLVHLDATGAVLNDGFSGGVPSGEVRAIELAGGNVYVGGGFAGQLRRYDAFGIIDADWKPVLDGSVDGLDVEGDRVYVVGTFDHIAGIERSGAGAVSTASNFALRGWNPAPAGVVTGFFTTVNAIHVTDSTAFIGGNFAFAGGEPRDSFAAVDLAAGTAKAPAISVGGSVRTISSAGGRLFVGGDFVSIEGVRRRRLAAIGADGRATAWNPGADGYVFALVASPDGQRLYAGGEFANIGGAPRARLAALSPSSDAALGFDPGPSGRVRSLAVAPDSATLYVGGDFATIGQGTPVAREYLAALDTTTGAVNAWDPNPDDLVFQLAQAPGGAPLYVYGSFDHIGSQAPQPERALFAALDPVSGAAGDLVLTHAGGPLQDFAPTSTGIYLAGGFNFVQGVQRFGFAQVGVDGALTGFAPTPTGDGYAIAPADGGTVIIGGAFNALQGSDHRRLAEVDPLTGAPTAWRPSLFESAFALHVDGRNLWVAGGGDEGFRPGGSLRRYIRPADPVTPPPPGGGAAPDTTAPRITAARLTRTRFAVGRKPTPLIAARRGTRVKLTLSERASLVLRVERQRPRRRVAGRCRPVTRRNAARRQCRRFVLAGTLRRADVAQQASIAFSGRLGRKALRRGPHRFSIVAVDAAGNRSARVRLAFRVLRG